MSRFDYLPNYVFDTSTDGMLYKSVGKPMRNYRIFGNNEGVGDKTKNLIDLSQARASYAIAGITWTNDGKKIIANGTLTASLSSFPLTEALNLTQIIPGKTYSFSSFNDLNLPNKRFYLFMTIYKYSTGGLSRYLSSYNNNTFTLTEDEYIHASDIRIYATAEELFTVTNEEFTPMIAEENALGEYEPYGYKIPVILEDSDEIYQKTTNIYIPNPLGKIGNTVDYIDFKEQKAYYNTTSKTENVTLPEIPTPKYLSEVNVSMGTAVQPSSTSLEYYRTPPGRTTQEE